MREVPLALVGTTGSGKSQAAIALASELDAEVVSVDSMLVYRGMDIGTAKPTPAERARVPHHLIDVVEPSERFTAARFQSLSREAIDGIRSRGRRTLLAGGTGLYFRAVVDGLAFPGEDPEARLELEHELEVVGPLRLHERLARMDPPAAAKIQPGNGRRTVRALEVAAATGSPYSTFSTRLGRYDAGAVRGAGVELASDDLTDRLRLRWERMMDLGWVEEVRALMNAGYGGWITSSQAIGYAELAEHLKGRLSLTDAAEQTMKRTRNLARRQRAWFRKDPRIRWFKVGLGGAMEVLDDLRTYLGAA